MNNCEALLLSLYICQCALILQWSHYLIGHSKAGGTLGLGEEQQGRGRLMMDGQEPHLTVVLRGKRPREAHLPIKN